MTFVIGFVIGAIVGGASMLGGIRILLDYVRTAGARFVSLVERLETLESSDRETADSIGSLVHATDEAADEREFLRSQIRAVETIARDARALAHSASTRCTTTEKRLTDNNARLSTCERDCGVQAEQLAITVGDVGSLRSALDALRTTCEVEREFSAFVERRLDAFAAVYFGRPPFTVTVEPWPGYFEAYKTASQPTIERSDEQ